ncbi:hypothetical protein CDAR_416331 [Caerostris darwini]|uniref:Secreted protein n=1 Tax=Caerostris darwini TaxID=1538125 RepID=A0AAV4SS82_9ARAC|nr:hypothetical protein CDAR_416331 [Caerostris darwini]
MKCSHPNPLICVSAAFFFLPRFVFPFRGNVAEAFVPEESRRFYDGVEWRLWLCSGFRECPLERFCVRIPTGCLSALKRWKDSKKRPIRDFLRLFGQIYSVVCIGKWNVIRFYIPFTSLSLQIILKFLLV